MNVELAAGISFLMYLFLKQVFVLYTTLSQTLVRLLFVLNHLKMGFFWVTLGVVKFALLLVFEDSFLQSLKQINWGRIQHLPPEATKQYLPSDAAPPVTTSSQ